MEEILIKVKNEREYIFIKDLLKRLRIQFEMVSKNECPSAKEVKESVIKGQLAYKNGKVDQFKEIDPKDMWK
jgi:hypothetical protein